MAASPTKRRVLASLDPNASPSPSFTRSFGHGKPEQESNNAMVTSSELPDLKKRPRDETAAAASEQLQQQHRTKKTCTEDAAQPDEPEPLQRV
jgi:hypothetical protein